MSLTIRKRVDGTDVTETILVGQVVDTGSTYLGDCDSSYHVVYFDYESGEFKRYGTGYSLAPYTIDASPEIMEAYEATKAAQKAAAHAFYLRDRIRREHAEAEREAATPTKGKVVRVVRGRKVPIGTEGVVKVYCPSNYGYVEKWRVLLVTADGIEHWTDAYNVEVIAQSAEERVAV
jgi:hypothetical protein